MVVRPESIHPVVEWCRKKLGQMLVQQRQEHLDQRDADHPPKTKGER